MDFNADECRIVVVATLPRAINLQEEFISAYLRDSGFMKKRLNQRIIQALGRCNRADNDFGVYILADRRFATHFSLDANKVGIPANIIAETDMAQVWAEVNEAELVKLVEDLLSGNFSQYDAELQSYRASPLARPKLSKVADTADDEVPGWTALFDSQNYEIAARCFERCWEKACEVNLIEMGALHGWNWAKALYLQSQLNEPSAREKSLQVLEEAIKRGGKSSWFNRLRASLNRARQSPKSTTETLQDEYAGELLRVFDDLLEKVGVKGNQFEQWCEKVTINLQSKKHAQYQVGLEQLGKILGYVAQRPKYPAATDCYWRGIFGNTREVVTFEAKIDDTPSQQITHTDMGQAHNQLNRALTQYQKQGFTVRGTIVTHLTTLAPGVESSAGVVKVLEKDAIFALWERVKLLLSQYRDDWSPIEISARLMAAKAIHSKLPATGWLIRALDTNERFITANLLLQEWP